MKRLSFLLLFLPLFTWAQTAQLAFKYPSGSSVGRWKVLDIPTSMFGSGTRQGQILIYYPAGKDSAHVGLGIWQPGKGETNTSDITEIYTSSTGKSLPGMIQAGLNPYSVLPNGDTIWHALVCIHNDFQSSYRAYLSSIVPWILDKIGLKYNPTYTWASGLSEGGAGTWGIFCVDSLLSRRIHVNVAMATGGYDNFLTDARLLANFTAACRNGVTFMPYIGTQDPGYNPGGFLATDAFLKTHALPGHYYPTVITNGTHSANVWDVPFKSRGFWDLLAASCFKGPVVTPPTTTKSIPHAVLTLDSSVINYPNSVVHLSASGSYATNGKIVAGDFYLDSGDKKVILSPSDSEGVCASGLRPGSYRFKLVVTDSLGNKDSAYATVRLNAVVIPACPVCPPPVVCPPQRTVVGIQITLYGAIINIPLVGTKISFSDGTTQP